MSLSYGVRQAGCILRGRNMWLAGNSSYPMRRMMAEAKAEAPKPTIPQPPRSSSLWQRLSSFLVGVGVGSLIGYYHLTKELEGSTATVMTAVKKSHADLHERIKKLEESL